MVVIREAGIGDAGVIRELVSGCYRRYSVTDNYTAEMVDALIALRGSVGSIVELIETESVFVAAMDGEIVGMVSVFQNEITKLFVRSDIQRQGIGRALFEHARSFIGQQGFGDLFLGVAVPSAEGFYTKMGMHAARHKEITRGPCKGRRIVIMRAALDI